MVKHLVLWKLKESDDGQSKRENARRIKTESEAPRRKIAEIKALEVGLNFNDSVATFVNLVREERVVADYEV